ncbi:MAG: extracellular solute-binding protein [Oscillospiraceae bacterium]|nr:extracellular solute-binding protein [Oscillospiraceae bacterium]
MKKNFRSLIASVLAVAMLFTLAACGAPGGQSGSSGTPGGQSASSGSPAPSGNKSGRDGSPEFVYVSSFREVKNEDNQGIGAACFTDRGFYTTPSEVVGQREPEEGEVPEYEGQFDIYEERLYFVSFDGERTKLENYEPLRFTPAEGREGYGELSKLACDADGSLAALYHMWENWIDAPEGMSEEDPEYWNYYHYEESWVLRTMDQTGRELNSTKIEVGDGEWFWPNSMVIVGGKVLVACSDGLHIFNTDGSPASQISMNGYVQDVVVLRDGTPCLVYSDNMTNETKLGAIDLNNGRVTQTWKCPMNGYGYISGGGDYDLYYQSGINIYGYRLDTESGEKLFDWLNADVSQQNLSGYTVRPDGSFFAVTNTWDGKWENVTTEFVTLEKKSFADVPQKEALTLACQWVDGDMQNAVIRFNRSSPVRINVIDYSQYNNEDDWNAGMTKLTTEIMAGSMPDIIALNGLPYQQMAAKGLLEDLYPFMEKDSEISREDFMPNVLKALEVGGGLYSTVTSFSVVTLAGSSKVVGDKPGWSVDDLRAALASMPEGCTVLNQYTTSGDILRAGLTIDADYYIDWETGKVNFDSKEFVDLLNLAKLFPNSFDWSTYDWEEYESESARIAAGKQMLMQMYIGSFEDLAMNEAQFGGSMTYIGYPTVSGVGSYLNLSSGYGISSTCADKEAAWQFLRGFMTAKALENGYYWGFPARTELLEKKLQEAMTVEYEKDANGGYLLDEKGERIPVAKGGFWMDGMDEPTNFYALTQEQADKVMELINSTDKVYMENTAALNIIFEQVDAFLSGQKTAEEIAKLVQGKMSIYVNEQL